MALGNRVFLDSSVLITALLSSKGGSFYILKQYRDTLRFFINEYVLAETIAVLRKKFPKHKNLEHNLYLLIGFSKIEVLPNPEKKRLKPLFKLIEKEDAPILASALEHCDYLLTLDNDFLSKDVVSFTQKKNLTVIKPAELLKKIGD